MINIVVLDTDGYFRKHVKEIIKGWVERKGFEADVRTFTKVEQLLQSIDQGRGCHIVFAECSLITINDVIRIRQKSSAKFRVYFIFFVSLMDSWIQTPNDKFLQYIEKDDQLIQKHINDCLNNIFEDTKKQVFCFVNGYREIKLSELIYLESQKHKIIFHVGVSNPRRYHLYNTLDKVQDSINDSHFIRSHQSYLVNMKYINNIKRYQLELENQIILSIPKSKYKQVYNEFIKYRSDYDLHQ